MGQVFYWPDSLLSHCQTIKGNNYQKQLPHWYKIKFSQTPRKMIHNFLKNPAEKQKDRYINRESWRSGHTQRNRQGRKTIAVWNGTAEKCRDRSRHRQNYPCVSSPDTQRARLTPVYISYSYRHIHVELAVVNIDELIPSGWCCNLKTRISSVTMSHGVNKRFLTNQGHCASSSKKMTDLDIWPQNEWVSRTNCGTVWCS